MNSRSDRLPSTFESYHKEKWRGHSADMRVAPLYLCEHSDRYMMDGTLARELHGCVPGAPNRFRTTSGATRAAKPEGPSMGIHG
jgi:hypothetical protein